MKTIYTKLFIFLLLLPAGMLAQSVSGTVTEQASGLPLPGASIVVQGSSNGTSSDIDGKFTLTGVKNGDVIVVSSIGFTQQTVTYNGQKTLSFALVEEASQLQEVVVQVGYGSVRKKDATGSVTTVSEKEFNRGVNITTENLLNGRVAGLTINTSGAPGSGSQIRIRGGSSLFASNDPLIVIDGLPIENSTNTGSTSFLASLNPSVIESVTVLKDASATAIYGSRAANGVIIITTKKGGKSFSAEYNVQYGTGSLIKTVDVFGANEYRELINRRYPTDDPDAPSYNSNLDKVSRLGTANTDWQRAIYRNQTDLIDQTLSLRGNLFGVIPTRFTVGRTFQEGLRLTNEFTRNTIGVALNPSFFSDHLKFRVNANYSNENSRFADGVEGSAISFDPTQPVYDANSPYGGFFQYWDQNAADPQLLPNVPRNPVAQLINTFDSGRNNRIFGNVEVDYKFHFFPDLRAVINLGYDESNGLRNRFAPAFEATSFVNANRPLGTRESNTGWQRNKLLDAYLVYNKTINDFGIEATAGYSYQGFDAEYYSTGNINNPTLGSNFPETTRNTPVVLIGFFGRTNLTYKDFLLTLSYRRDGTSRFSKDNRWGNFPAAALAWRMNETFFKDSKVISDLKLRLGYGVTGQQVFSEANAYLQKYNIGNGASQYYFGTGPLPIAVADRISPNLKWESTITYNAGIDYGFADNRITGAVDVFYKKTEDLIVDAAISDGTNFSNRAFQNIGSFTTKGIEFSVNATIVKPATDTGFNWNVNFNATKFERRIDELAYNSDIILGDNIAGTGTPAQIFSEGYTPYSFYVYKQLYDENNKPIEGAYADLNGDGIRNDADRYLYKNPDPDFTLGFMSTMNYKRFDLSFNLRASIGNHVFNGVNAGSAQYANLFNATIQNIPRNVLDTEFTRTSDVLLSDLYVENASFLRMDNITLGYTFPSVMDGKASMRFSVGCQNAFVLTEYSGLDPEITNNGVDKTIYPRQRTFLFGANIKF